MIDRGREPTLRFQTPDDTRGRLARVLARLDAHGLEVPPGSRVWRFIRLSERFAAQELGPAGLGSLRDVNELLEANRDFAEFATVVEHLLPPEPPADAVLLRKLRDVLGGAALPGEDANALARNTQFELYVAALCCRAGLAPRLLEPDCIVTVLGIRLGIAAKRAGGPNVRGLVKEGARQLRKAGLVGVVAVSLDRLFAPNDERMAADSAEGFKAAAREIAANRGAPKPPLTPLNSIALSRPARTMLVSTTRRRLS